MSLTSLSLATAGMTWTAATAAPGGATHAAYLKTRWVTQPTDHFAFPQRQSPPQTTTFQQRVLVNFTHYGGEGSPVFFYFGNEAPVELYAEHTGLMWENAPAFKAGVVFAEHRGYGQSLLGGGGSETACDLSLITTEQALADFADVIETLRRERRPSAVIGFGGSYGGMLATWFRRAYPHLVDGVIAASAPILAYLGMEPPYEPNAYARVVTRDAGPVCAKAVRAALKQMTEVGAVDPATLSREFKTCAPISRDDVPDLVVWAQDYYNTLAMGEFDFPSDYVSPVPGVPLPARPLTKACAKQVAWSAKGFPLRGLVEAAGIYHNVSGDVPCYFNSPKGSHHFQRGAPPKRLGIASSAMRLRSPVQEKHEEACTASWDWQFCTQHAMPFSQGTPQDMFYPFVPYDFEEETKACEARFGTTRREPLWSRVAHGGLRGFQATLTNVVFSNGARDPWSAGGVTSSRGFHPSVKTVWMPSGAHHTDLMFSDPRDPADIVRARVAEVEAMWGWVRQAQGRHNQADGVVALAID